MHEIGYLTSAVDLTPLHTDQTSRFQHTYVIGQTGTGKTTWARSSFLQDVYNGFGACYFDFHGRDAQWLLNHIPPDRVRDVIYLDAMDPNFAIGYNVLDGVWPGDYATFTDEIVGSLRHIHAASWGARMDDILINAIRPLFDLPPASKGTLLGSVRMLNDPYYRNWVTKHCQEKTVRDFWEMEFKSWTKGDQAHNVNSSLNKIRRFQSSPILRRILGQQKSTMDFARAIQNGQILIFNLDKWAIGTVNANTLASLILSRLIYEATHRAFPQVAGQDAEDLITPFHIYIDEFHSITSLAMVEALSGIRKFRVGFTLCHQYTNQLSPDVLDAIKGNVGTKIAFRIGGDDAEDLHRALDVTEPKHLMEQSDYEFYVSMKDGKATKTRRGFSLPPNYQRHGLSQSVVNTMHAKFARPVATIDEQYDRWQNSRHYGGSVDPKTVKKKQAEPKPTEKRSGSGDFKSIGSIMLG